MVALRSSARPISVTIRAPRLITDGSGAISEAQMTLEPRATSWKPLRKMMNSALKTRTIHAKISRTNKSLSPT